MNSAVVVVDVQNGFVTEGSQHVIPHVVELAHHAQRVGVALLFTRFFNHPDSPFRRWVRWDGLAGPPQTYLHPELLPFAKLVFDKSGYTSLTPQLRSWLREHDITRIWCCGIATENCVLKTAVDAFEENIEPLVIVDACASDAGTAFHEMGLQVLARFIGKGQRIRALSDATPILHRDWESATEFRRQFLHEMRVLAPIATLNERHVISRFNSV